MREYQYKLLQEGMEVARVFAPTNKEAKREINHYAAMYGQDGPVEIVKIKPRRAKRL